MYRTPNRIAEPRRIEIQGDIRTRWDVAHRHPTIPTRSAYGICVRTWSMWSQLEAMLERIVVSEIGEQWSPQTDPARTDETAPSRIVYVSGLRAGSLPDRRPPADDDRHHGSPSCPTMSR
jgi:hypothetical protein